MRVLLLRAKHLFVAAKVAGCGMIWATRPIPSLGIPFDLAGFVGLFQDVLDLLRSQPAL